MRFALDISTVSHALRDEGGAASRLRILGPHRVALPTVVLFEVRFGLLRMGRHRLQASFEAMADAMGTVDFDAEAADHAARIRVHLESHGTPIGLAPAHRSHRTPPWLHSGDPQHTRVRPCARSAA